MNCDQSTHIHIKMVLENLNKLYGHNNIRA